MSPNNFLKQLGQKSVLVPYIEAYFARGEFPDELTFTVHMNKEGDNAFHPSGAIQCSRAQFADIVGDLPPSDYAAANKAFMFGHYIHEIVQTLCVDHGFTYWEYIEQEARIYRYEGRSLLRLPENEDPQWHKQKDYLWWGRGFTDIASCTVNGAEYLVDIKTMNANDYRQQNLPTRLYDKYYTQLQLYMDWFGKDKGIILCVEKDSPHGFKEFHYKRDPKVAEAVYKRWDIVAEALKTDVPPPHDLCIEKGTSCPAKGLYIDDSSSD